MADLAAPGYGFEGGADGEAPGGMPERDQGGAGGCDQVSIELGFLFLAATVLDGESPFFGQPAVIAPEDRRPALPFVSLREQAHHHAHPAPLSALMVLCSTDFFGDHPKGSRAKARNEAESSR